MHIAHIPTGLQNYTQKNKYLQNSFQKLELQSPSKPNYISGISGILDSAPAVLILPRTVSCRDTTTRQFYRFSMVYNIFLFIHPPSS